VANDQRQYWDWASELLDTRSQRKWTNFSWITTRALISSLNDRLNTLTPRFVDELRAQWMASPVIAEEQREHRLVIDRRDCTSFIVVGDTGEQDASQYVVVPALENELRDHPDIGLMVVCSDVIYPSGDVNDYVDGFYVPYQNLRTLPIYALPGNHDWYDGLAGFMWNFCDQPPLPASAYGISGSPSFEWLGRLFWRRPSRRTRTEGLDARRRMHRVAATVNIGQRRHQVQAIDAGGPMVVPPLQVSPYFAIQTKDLLLVCIDTGIDGTIDHAQGEWLLRVSQLDGPKMLLTGKPLLVNQAVHACAIGGAVVTDDDGNSFASVLEIVKHPTHTYAATLGGDIHNYQLYKDDEMPHIVSGGGGAFMSATHTITEAANSPTYAEKVSEPPLRLSPTEPQSLSHFAQLMLPRVWRLERFLLALFIGGVAGAVLPQVIQGGAARVAAVSAIVLGVVVAVRSLFVPHSWLGSAPFRAAVAVTGGLAGVVLTSTTAWLDPVHHAGDLVLVVLSLAITIVVLQAVRWTGWSSPAPPSELTLERQEQSKGLPSEPWVPARPQSGDNFVRRMLVVAAVLAVAAIVVALLGQTILAVTIGLTLVVWLVGWFVGRRWSAWRSLGAPLAFVVAGGVVAVCGWLVVGVHPGVIVHVGVTAILLPAIAMLAALIATCVLAAIIAVVVGGGPPTPLAVAAGDTGHTPDPEFPKKRFETGWGRVGSVAPWLLAATFVAALVVLAVWWPPIGSHIWPLARLTGTVGEIVTRRAGVSAAVAISTTGLLIFLVDSLRRHTGRAFKAWAALLALVICVFGAPSSFWSGWLLHDVIGVVVIATYLGLLVLVGNLVLVGGPGLALDGDAHSDTETVLDYDAAKDVLAWRRRDDVERPAQKFRRRANIVSPGSDKPQGPLQKLVAEIFDSDSPPFFKNFVVINPKPGTGDVAIDVDVVIVTGTSNDPPYLPPDQTFGAVTVRHRY
jgi:hypothetical protein